MNNLLAVAFDPPCLSRTRHDLSLLYFLQTLGKLFSDSIAFIGSIGQSWLLDKLFNDMKYGDYLDFFVDRRLPSSFEDVRVLANLLGAKFDPALMADIFADQPFGTAHARARGIDAYNGITTEEPHGYCLPDLNEILLVYFHIHKIAKDYPLKEITYLLLSERGSKENLREDLVKFYSENNWLIPSNMKIGVIYYGEAIRYQRNSERSRNTRKPINFLDQIGFILGVIYYGDAIRYQDNSERSRNTRKPINFLDQIRFIQGTGIIDEDFCETIKQITEQAARDTYKLVFKKKWEAKNENQYTSCTKFLHDHITSLSWRTNDLVDWYIRRLQPRVEKYVMPYMNFLKLSDQILKDLDCIKNLLAFDSKNLDAIETFETLIAKIDENINDIKAMTIAFTTVIEDLNPTLIEHLNKLLSRRFCIFSTYPAAECFSLKYFKELFEKLSETDKKSKEIQDGLIRITLHAQGDMLLSPENNEVNSETECVVNFFSFIPSCASYLDKQHWEDIKLNVLRTLFSSLTGKTLEYNTIEEFSVEDTLQNLIANRKKELCTPSSVEALKRYMEREEIPFRELLHTQDATESRQQFVVLCQRRTGPFWTARFQNQNHDTVPALCLLRTSTQRLFSAP